MLLNKRKQHTWKTRFADFHNNLELINVILAVGLTIPLILSMINTKPFLYLQNNYYQLISTTIIMFYCGFKYYKNMMYEIFKWHVIGMNTLVGMSTLISFIYSIYLMFSKSAYSITFEASATIITTLLVGDYLNTKIQSKVNSKVKSIMSLQSFNSNVIKDNTVVEMPTKLVKVDDILLVKKGDKIPLDGILQSDYAYVDESLLTGESKTILKKKNDYLIGGTINIGEPFTMVAKKVGNDTVLAAILEKVEEIQSQKPRLQRIADKIAKYFTPIVILIAIASFFIQYFLWHKNDLNYAINVMVTIMIISCPCALGIATPLAVAIGLSKSLQEGILFNNTDIFEKINKIDAIAFDKTGTLTTGKLRVTKILGNSTNLQYLYNLEILSNHPIAKSIVAYFDEKYQILPVSDYQEIPGQGIKALINEHTYEITSYEKAKSLYNINENLSSEIKRIEKENKLVLAFIKDNSIENIIILEDEIRDSAIPTINRFKNMGIKTFLISGDSAAATQKVANLTGITNYYANVQPIKKAEILQKIRKTFMLNSVAFVGDGINDLVVLKQADFAIAMDEGSQVAIENSDLTILNANLYNVYKALVCVRKTRKMIWFNFLWAFIYNIVAIPLAFLGIIPPMYGAIAMGLSELTIISNSILFSKIDFKFK